MAISSDHYSLVCAIDFGTTFSGIAYSLKREYRDDPMKITVPEWNAPSSSQISYKTPTTILLDNKEEFVAFGYDAESKYAELAEDEEQHDFFYCRRFKMLLYNKLRGEKLKMNTKIKDITEKKEMDAIDVFRHSIKYFRDLMVNTVDKKGIGVKPTDIKWVLTVPAMWSDPAKQFMTEAAERAGIERSKLVLALEPEAASIYCSRLPLSKSEVSDDLGMFGVGKKYLVLDAGGGTVDITVHEVTKDNNLKELEKASGGDWGGTCVDNYYKDTLMEVVGKEVMEAFRQKHTGEYIELFRDFEMKKRTPINEKQTLVTMRMPGMLSGFYEEFCHKKLKDAIKNSKYSRSMKWEGDKLRITPTFFENFFACACVGIVDHVRDLLGNLNVEKIDSILMVGGFSESPILQKRIRAAFPDHRVVVPNEAGLAVLRGAVLFGHNPSIVSERIAKYSYGIASLKKIGGKVHTSENVFDVHVRRGTSIGFNEVQPGKLYEPNRDDQKIMDLDLYVSELEECPKCVEKCDYLGTLSVVLPKPVKGKKSGVYVQMSFGDTELRVKAVNKINNEETIATFDFLKEKQP